MLIEERINDAVEALKGFAQIEQTNRQYFESRMNDFSNKIGSIQHDLTVILSVAKKRRSDWMREPNTEVFRERNDE